MYLLSLFLLTSGYTQWGSGHTSSPAEWEADNRFAPLSVSQIKTQCLHIFYQCSVQTCYKQKGLWYRLLNVLKERHIENCYSCFCFWLKLVVFFHYSYFPPLVSYVLSRDRRQNELSSRFRYIWNNTFKMGESIWAGNPSIHLFPSYFL